MADDKPTGSQGKGEKYADPGYQSDKQPRYPVTKDGKLNADRVRAAWSYIHQADNRRLYSAQQLAHIEGVIRSAAREVGVEIAEEKEGEGMFYFDGFAIKAHGNGEIEGLLVPFGSVDRDGDVFTAETDFDVEDGDRRSLYYRHSLDPRYGTKKIGRISLTKEAAGIVARGRLYHTDPMVVPIWEAAQKDEVGLSSGAAAHLVRRMEIKEGVWKVTDWAIAEASLTPNPCNEHARIMSTKEYLGDGPPAGATPPEADPSSDVRRLLSACERYLLAEVKQGKVLSTANLTSIQRVGDSIIQMRGHVMRHTTSPSADTQKAMLDSLGQMQDLISELLAAGGVSYGPGSLYAQLQAQQEMMLRAQKLTALGVNTTLPAGHSY